MKKQLLLLVMMLLPMVAMADETVLVMELNSGETAQYLLLDKPKLTMDGTQIKISTASVQAGFERSEVKRFYFTKEATSVKEVAKNTLIYHQINNDQLEIIGLSKDDHVNVFNMAGTPTGQIARSKEKAVVNLSGHQKGVYLIQVRNGQTIKFIKK
jgi:hypothetical protein